uniref:Desmoglein-2-like n=2 Tax=Kryptolebias marmoratus TaxID=37003 RepID=A0A3Q3AJ64_KRYMA
MTFRIKVEDENDNPPVFGETEPGEVDEHSPRGTVVMKVKATDRDEPEHDNSKIAYSIRNQQPSHGIFAIQKDGTIYIHKPLLDREAQDQYILTVIGKDLYGEPGGHTATGTVTINVRDVNDNMPTLEKEQYEGSIEENQFGVEVMRIKTEDLDLRGTDNWEAVFDLVSGNEAGYFSIKTDPKTNEGILMLDKPVDYEDVKDLNLGLIVRNKVSPFDGSGSNAGAGIGFGGGAGGGASSSGGGASSSGGGASSSGGGASSSGGGAGSASANKGTGGSASSPSGASSQSGASLKTYPIKINVKNQLEGPHFNPKVKAIPITKGLKSFKVKEVIASYPAIDKDTGKPAENVRYAKGSDPYNWFTIDPKTAEIKLNKIPDKTSPALVNGTYFAEVLCISEDIPVKTVTGTIAIQLKDFNGHCPTLTSSVQMRCTTDKTVIVNAKDEDTFPNGPPFAFTIIPEGTQGKWQVEHFNETAAIVRAQESMWPGFYKLQLMVKDQQGEACPELQEVTVQVCTCDDGAACRQRSGSHQTKENAKLGSAGIGLILLGLLLLLLIPLLLFLCECGDISKFQDRFAELPFGPKDNLKCDKTEGKGDNTVVPLLYVPVKMEQRMAQNSSEMALGFNTQQFVQSKYGMKEMNNGASEEHSSSVHRNGMHSSSVHRNGTIQSKSKIRESGGGGISDYIVLPDTFPRGVDKQMSSEDENPQVFGYEGQDSSAGSIGCCSQLAFENDLCFLDDLGPSFKTLAEICGGTKVQTEKKQVVPPLPNVFGTKIQTSETHLVAAQQMSQPAKLQSTKNTDHTVVSKTTEQSQAMKSSMITVKKGMSSVKQEMGSQCQMLLVQQQQPAYYTTTSMLQPMHYAVQPPFQNIQVVPEASAANLQNTFMVVGAEAGYSHGVLVQSPIMMCSVQAPSMLLMENSRNQESCTNLIHTENPSGSPTIMAIDDRVPAWSQTGLILVNPSLQ